MEELKVISERITVLRDGQYIDTLQTDKTDINEVVSLMVGRELFMRIEKKTNTGR